MRYLSFLIVILLTVAFSVITHASGLLVPNDPNMRPLKVTDHLVQVKIHDSIGLTTLTQTFRNDSNRRLEATYIFPLPEEADLTDFQMSFNGKMVQGEVLPANEARQIFESIVRQSKDPGLIEFIGRRLLRMRVFPIEPKSNTTIKVSYQQICRPISGMKGFHYPLKTTGTSGQAYGTVRFDIDLDSKAPLKNIWSPTHAVEIVRDGEFEAKIAYEASGGSLEEDFILLYSNDSSDLGMSAIAHKPKEMEDGHFLLLLTPKQLWPENEYTPQDVVFVVDTSGSMGGDKIKQAKLALKYCVDQLDERDRFSVVRFSTGFDVLFDDIADANLDNKNAAKVFIEKFGAQGGTNISDTMKHVAGMNPGDEARPFVVVFVTDGQGNRTPDEIMAVLGEASGDGASMRIFPFGVGHDVNTMLLDRMSGKFKGRPVYVQPGENLELVLGDFFATISQPVLTNLKLTLPNIGVTERFPVTLGDLYHGQQLTIAAKYSKTASGPVKLTAMRNGQQVEYSWPNVEFANTGEAEYVPSIWAGRKIAWMVDQIRLHGENDEMITEIIQLSQKYGIQTPYSSWFVNPEGTPQPIRLTQNNNRLGVPAMRRLRVLPGGGGRGGGGGGDFGGGGSGGGGTPPGGGGGGNADEEAEREFLYSKSIRNESGKEATIIASLQSDLREAGNKDVARQRLDSLAVRVINDLTYYRVGSFLVDETFSEEQELVLIQFASDAYFELVAAKPELKELFAASPNIVIPADEKHVFVVVSEDNEEVITEFTDELREQFEL